MHGALRGASCLSQGGFGGLPGMGDWLESCCAVCFVARVNDNECEKVLPFARFALSLHRQNHTREVGAGLISLTRAWVSCRLVAAAVRSPPCSRVLMIVYFKHLQ